MALLGSAILAFGLYNVHAFSGVTEGGVLGLTLLLYHWFGLSPSISGLVLNAACYIGGWRTLGRSFIFYSVIAGGGFSAFYAFFERFDPLWPQLAQMPLVAAIVGALFVGIGVGLSVRAGGAPGGALAQVWDIILAGFNAKPLLAAAFAAFLAFSFAACCALDAVRRFSRRSVQGEATPVLLRLGGWRWLCYYAFAGLIFLGFLFNNGYLTGAVSFLYANF